MEERAPENLPGKGGPRMIEGMIVERISNWLMNLVFEPPETMIAVFAVLYVGAGIKLMSYSFFEPRVVRVATEKLQTHRSQRRWQ
jgi:hypothetical protein